MHAIRVHRTGGPDVLSYEEVDRPVPVEGEALVKVEASGVNFIDVYNRSGLYKKELPFTPGVEAAGIVEALGPGVSGLRVGERVAYAARLGSGSYADYATAPAQMLVPIPEGMASEQAAAAMLQGMTAHYLTHTTYPIKRGDRVLVHAAAGGAGSLVVQMAKQLGATVYGTVSTDEKAALAREAGADEVILYTQRDFEAEVKRLTDGEGVNVVYDAVGKDTFTRSLNSLAMLGYMVSFGQSSGSVPTVEMAAIARSSLFLTRPTLFHYIARRENLLMHADAVFNMIASGALKLRIDRALPLSQAAEAHRLLEGRATAGKLLLIPE